LREGEKKKVYALLRVVLRVKREIRAYYRRDVSESGTGESDITVMLLHSRQRGKKEGEISSGHAD